MTLKTCTSYEWVAEKLDSNGDVEEVSQATSFVEVSKFFVDAPTVAIALCRRVHSIVDGDEVDRQYAYVENGALPEFFEGGCKVPKKFKGEFK